MALPTPAALRDRPLHLHTERLNWQHIASLRDTLCSADITECTLMGLTPEQALATALVTTNDQAFAACLEDGAPVGAFGWTPQGAIWSLWVPLSPGIAREVLLRTPWWVAFMVASSGLKHLCNFVHTKNTRTIKWLKASRCFDLDSYISKTASGDYFYFQTKEPEG